MPLNFKILRDITDLEGSLYTADEINYLLPMCLLFRGFTATDDNLMLYTHYYILPWEHDTLPCSLDTHVAGFRCLRCLKLKLDVTTRIPLCSPQLLRISNLIAPQVVPYWIIDDLPGIVPLLHKGWLLMSSVSGFFVGKHLSRLSLGYQSGSFNNSAEQMLNVPWSPSGVCGLIKVMLMDYTKKVVTSGALVVSWLRLVFSSWSRRVWVLPQC